MPLKAQRIIVTGRASGANIAKSAYSLWYDDILTDDKMFQYSAAGSTGDSYSYEFVLQGENPELGTIYHPFGYSGQTSDADTKVSAICFRLSSFPWIAWENDHIVGLKIDASTIRKGRVGLSRIMIQSGSSSKAPSEANKRQILLYVTTGYSENVAFKSIIPTIDNFSSWYNRGMTDFMISTNSQAIPNGRKTLIWNFDGADRFLSSRSWNNTVLVIYPILGYNLSFTTNDTYGLNVSTYKNTISPEKEMGGLIFTDAQGTKNSTVFPYITLEFCFLPDELNKVYNMAVPVLTKTQVEKLFSYVGKE